MISTLRTALFDKVKSLFYNRFYFAEAPQQTEYPYGVMSELPGVRDYDSEDIYDDVFIQVNGYGKILATLETIEDTVKSALDSQQASFTLADYEVIDISLVFFRTTKLNGTPDGIYQFTHQYRIQLELK